MEFTQVLMGIAPMTILIILVLVTKRMLESAIIAMIVGYLLISPKDFFINLSSGILDTIAGPTYSFLIATVGLMGIFVRLLIKSGGTVGFGKKLGKLANSRRKSLVVTFILGLVVFIDEYLNSIVVTASMRDLTDKYKAPRIMLACTVNAAGVPACVFAPISIWAIYYIGLFKDSGVLEGTGMTGLQMYIHVIPFMLYPAVFMVIIALLGLDLFPKYGPMKKAYYRAEQLGDVFPESGCTGEKDEEVEEGHPAFFIVPLAAIIVITIITGDLVIATFIGVAVIGFMLVASKKISIAGIGDEIVSGVKDMVSILLLLLVCFTFTDICAEAGLADVVIGAVSGVVPATLLPAVMFVLVSLLSWMMGSFWATAALALTIIAPLAESMGVNMTLMLGVLVSGSVFPATCSFTCETVVMSSQSAQVDPAEMALANLPYAFTAAGIATVIYVILGFAI